MLIAECFKYVEFNFLTFLYLRFFFDFEKFARDITTPVSLETVCENCFLNNKRHETKQTSTTKYWNYVHLRNLFQAKRTEKW